MKIISCNSARLGLVALLLLRVPACGPGDPGPALDLPARPDHAPGGEQLRDELGSLDPDAWEERIYAEVIQGNVPGWLRELQRVEMVGEVAGRQRQVTFWAAPDYLAVGSDDDFVLVPLSPGTALRIAERVGGSLPTPAMVDAVWAAARVRLTPVRFEPHEGIRTVRYFLRHDAIIRGQRRQFGVRPGTFLAGHKLDIVRLGSSGFDSERATGGVALYGWHLPAGEPIQPVFPVLVNRPPHFSLGIRLVARDVLVDGELHDLGEVLTDPDLADLLAATAPESRPLRPPRVGIPAGSASPGSVRSSG